MDNRIVGAQRCACKNRISRVLAVDYGRLVCLFRTPSEGVGADGQVLINRRRAVCAADKLYLVECRVEAHKDGFGFSVPLTPAKDGDFVLYERQMRGIMHGDIVTVRPVYGP